MYDVTDDWMLCYTEGREGERQRRNDEAMMAIASAVVVCSPDLARSRLFDSAGDAFQQSA